MANFGTMFGNELRIEILMYLLENEEACVGRIVSDLGIRQSTVSNQLKILKLGRMVKTRKDGKKIFYSLSDSHISSLLTTLSEHAKEEVHERRSSPRSR